MHSSVYINQTLLEDYTEYKRMYKQEKIHLLITNEVTVVSEGKMETGV